MEAFIVPQLPQKTVTPSQTTTLNTDTPAEDAIFEPILSKAVSQKNTSDGGNTQNNSTRATDETSSSNAIKETGVDFSQFNDAETPSVQAAPKEKIIPDTVQDSDEIVTGTGVTLIEQPPDIESWALAESPAEELIVANSLPIPGEKSVTHHTSAAIINRYSFPEGGPFQPSPQELGELGYKVNKIGLTVSDMEGNKNISFKEGELLGILRSSVNNNTPGRSIAGAGSVHTNTIALTPDTPVVPIATSKDSQRTTVDPATSILGFLRKTDSPSQPFVGTQKVATPSFPVEQRTGTGIQLSKLDTMINNVNGKALEGEVKNRPHSISILNTPVQPRVELQQPQSTVLSQEKILSHIAQINPDTVSQSIRLEEHTLRQSQQGITLGAQHQQSVELVKEQPFSQQQFSLANEEQSFGQSTSTTKGAEVQPDSQFSQTLGQVSQEKPLAGTDGVKPAMFQHPLHFSEDSVVNQVLQKLRVNRGLRDSKMMLKLHPEELGELKVDVRLKNGTIQAQIVAQTQQVQEVLERNLTRLRDVMEQQGLTVEDIVVQLDQDGSQDRHLFEEHLAEDNGGFHTKKNKSSNTAFSLNPEEDESDKSDRQEQETVVNVKV